MTRKQRRNGFRFHCDFLSLRRSGEHNSCGQQGCYCLDHWDPLVPQAAAQTMQSHQYTMRDRR
jgi:hypothetical protein